VLLRTITWALAAQALYSLANLGAQWSLARYAPKEQFALYVQALSMLGLIGTIYTSMFVSPYGVLLARVRGAEESSEYVREVFSAQFWLACLLAIFGALAFSAASIASDSYVDSSVTIGFLIGAFGLLVRDCVRTTLFGRHLISRAFSYDVIYLGTLAAALVILVATNSLSATTVLFAAGTLALLSAATSIWESAATSWTSRTSARARELWEHGRWEFASSCCAWIYGQGWIWVVLLIGGPHKLAELAAARLLLAPLGMLWPGLANVFRPIFSDRLGRGANTSARHALILGLGIVAAASIAYAIVSFAFWDGISSVVFGEAYSFTTIDLVAWLLYFSLTGVNTMLGNLVRGALHFRSMTRGYLAAALVSVFVCLVIAWQESDTSKILWALVAAELALCASLLATIAGGMLSANLRRAAN